MQSRRTRATRLEYVESSAVRGVTCFSSHRSPQRKGILPHYSSQNCIRGPWDYGKEEPPPFLCESNLRIADLRQIACGSSSFSSRPVFNSSSGPTVFKKGRPHDRGFHAHHRNQRRRGSRWDHRHPLVDVLGRRTLLIKAVLIAILFNAISRGVGARNPLTLTDIHVIVDAPRLRRERYPDVFQPGVLCYVLRLSWEACGCARGLWRGGRRGTSLPLFGMSYPIPYLIARPGPISVRAVASSSWALAGPASSCRSAESNYDAEGAHDPTPLGDDWLAELETAAMTKDRTSDDQIRRAQRMGMTR